METRFLIVEISMVFLYSVEVSARLGGIVADDTQRVVVKASIDVTRLTFTMMLMLIFILPLKYWPADIRDLSLFEIEIMRNETPPINTIDYTQRCPNITVAQINLDSISNSHN